MMPDQSSDQERASITPVEKRIYVHFLDIHHFLRATVGNHVAFKKVWAEGRLAFRLAVLFSDVAYLPASTYYESELARFILSEHEALKELGFISLTAGETTLEEHREAKLVQYGSFSPGYLGEAYQQRITTEPPPYVQHAGSSTIGITRHWFSVLETGALFRQATESGIDLPSQIEKIWERIPEELAGRAFVPQHVSPLMQLLGSPRLPSWVLCEAIESPYIHGYAKRIKAGLVRDLIYLASPFQVRPLRGSISYKNLCRLLAVLDLMPVLRGIEARRLVTVKMMPDWSLLSELLRIQKAPTAQMYKLASSVLRGINNKPAARHSTKSCRRGTVTDRALRQRVRVGIVTALPIEYVAAKFFLESHRGIAIPGDPNRYLLGEVPSGERRVNVALTLLKRMGPTSAAAAATNLLRSFRDIRVIVMTGIACAVPNPAKPEDHVRLGDVVISDRKGVVDFEFGARVDGKVVHREAVPPPSAQMIELLNQLEVRELEGDSPWFGHIERLVLAHRRFQRPPEESDTLQDPEGRLVLHPQDPDRVPGQPRLFRGVIGSSGLLVRDAAYRNELRDTFDLRAIEMEGSGIAEAAWGFEQYYMVVRGASDYGDRKKGALWRAYAAGAAAAFTRSLLELWYTTQTT